MSATMNRYAQDRIKELEKELQRERELRLQKESRVAAMEAMIRALQSGAEVAA